MRIVVALLFCAALHAATLTPLAAATTLLPDLRPLAGPGRVHGWELDQLTHPGNTLLRLTTSIANLGSGPMELVGTEIHGETQNVVQRIYRSDGGYADVPAGTFSHHPSHHHIHFNQFSTYAIRAVLAGGGVGAVLRGGVKTSFCLEDVDACDLGLPGAPAEPAYVSCGTTQGISVGWADVYDKLLPDQWIDVTGLPDGRYWLEVVADPDNRLRESDETNNVVRIRIDLRIPRGSIAGFIAEDQDGDGMQTDSVDRGLVGWTAFLDVDGDRAFDRATARLPGEDSAQPIPDASTLFVEQRVQGLVGLVEDLDVFVDVSHPRPSDLRIYLTSPGGRRAALVLGPAVGGGRYRVMFDDEAVRTATTAPPAEPLAEFDGAFAEGHWRLEVADATTGAIGVLHGWALRLTHAEPNRRADSDGSFRFADLPPGPYELRALPPSSTTGWRSTWPPEGVHRFALVNGWEAQHKGLLWTRSTRIDGRVIHDLDGDGRRDPGDGGLAGWTVYRDLDNDGRLDRGDERLSPADLPIAIPDEGMGTSRLVVARSGLIENVSVELSIAHTFIPDLSLVLVSPSGTRVRLFNRLGTEGEDFTGTTFSDAAADPIADGETPYSGVFRPEQSLAALRGQPVGGTWRLEVQDHEFEDDGAITAWSLLVAYTEPTATADAGGGFAFTGLVPGGHVVRVVTPTGWRQIAPVGAWRLTLPMGGVGQAPFLVGR